jgi:hypothetical protein
MATKEKMGWGPVVATTALAAVDVATTPITLPLGPLAATEFLTVPLAFYTLTKKLDAYEGKGSLVPTDLKSNPLPLLGLGLVSVATPLLVGGLGIGAAALAWAKYKEKKDALDGVQEKLDQNVALNLLQPWMLAASAGAVAYARKATPMQTALTSLGGYLVGLVAHKAASTYFEGLYTWQAIAGEDA